MISFIGVERLQMRIGTIRRIGLVLCATCLGSISAFAHHSLSVYERSVSKTVEGTVREFEWINPHAKLVLVVMAADGTTKRWNFEGGGVRRLSSRGFVQDAIVLGQKLIVAYNPMRDGSAGGFFLGVRTEDGKTYGTMR